MFPLGPSYTIASQTGFRGCLLPGCLAHHVGENSPAFAARAVLLLGPSCTIANQAGFRASLWLGCWYEVTCFHLKSCASIGSKLHSCQPDSFQRFFVAWLTTLIRSVLLPLQELFFHEVQAWLLPASLVPEVLCGLAHHVGKRQLAFNVRAVLPLGPSCSIASQNVFNTKGTWCFTSRFPTFSYRKLMAYHWIPTFSFKNLMFYHGIFQPFSYRNLMVYHWTQTFSYRILLVYNGTSNIFI